MLSQTEVEVLQHCADGGLYKTAAREMHYSYEGARWTAKSAIRKLGARNITHAVALAFRAGLIR